MKNGSILMWQFNDKVTYIHELPPDDPLRSKQVVDGT
jgi:hypothetical protein